MHLCSHGTKDGARSSKISMWFWLGSFHGLKFLEKRWPKENQSKFKAVANIVIQERSIQVCVHLLWKNGLFKNAQGSKASGKYPLMFVSFFGKNNFRCFFVPCECFETQLNLINSKITMYCCFDKQITTSLRFFKTALESKTTIYWESWQTE